MSEDLGGQEDDEADAVEDAEAEAEQGEEDES